MKYDYNICLICGKRKGFGGKNSNLHRDCSKKLKAIYEAKRAKMPRGRILLNKGDII